MIENWFRSVSRFRAEKRKRRRRRKRRKKKGEGELELVLNFSLAGKIAESSSPYFKSDEVKIKICINETRNGRLIVFCEGLFSQM